MTDDRTLADAVCEIMSDRRQRSVRWIMNELRHRGITDVTPCKVSRVCRDEPGIEVVGVYSNRTEYRMTEALMDPRVSGGKRMSYLTDTPRRHAAHIIAYLYESEPVTVTALSRRIDASWKSTELTVRDLRRIGYIECEKNAVQRKYTLTPIGRRAAELLRELAATEQTSSELKKRVMK